MVIVFFYGIYLFSGKVKEEKVFWFCFFLNFDISFIQGFNGEGVVYGEFYVFCIGGFFVCGGNLF